MMDPKPGYLSTEFWTTLLAHVAAIVSLFLDIDPMISVAAFAASGVSQALYSLSRGQAKVATTQAAGQVVSTQAMARMEQYAAAVNEYPEEP